MSKVYLSSTLLDLKDERQTVTDWLLAAGFQPVHSYVASGETARDSCLEDIAGCELYVLIVGHRYGFQPKDGNPENLSITCLEFREAGRLKLPRLAFLRTSVPDIGLSDLNDPLRNPLIQTFRTEVGDTVRPAEFKDKTEFIAAFSAAILMHVMKLLNKRDANAPRHEQRITELETELQKVREEAVARVLENAAQPGSDALAQDARTALLRGETALAEQLLRQQEDRAAGVALEKRREAANLAREIAALAIGRDSLAALAAFERAARYLPDDLRTCIELGDAQVVAGQSNSAMVSYQTALTLANTIATRDPANTGWQHDLSVSYERIGDVLVTQGDGPGALATFLQGLAIREALAANDPANTVWQRDISVSHNKIGDVLMTQGDGPGALAAYRQSLAIAEALAAHDPANTQWERDLSVSHTKIGDVLMAQGDGPGALAAFRQGLTIREALAARDPANIEWQRDLSVCHNKIGNVLVTQGDGPEALAAYRQSLAIAEALVARDPANTEWQRDLSVSHNKVGDVLITQGDEPGALAAYRRDLAIAEALAARDSANAEWQRDLSVSHDRIGNVLMAQGDGPGALTAYRKSLAIRKALAARDPANTGWQRDLSVSHDKIGDTLVAQGDGLGALTAYRMSLIIRSALSTRDPANAGWQRDLIVSNVKLAEASGDNTYALSALRIAEDMQARGTLAPRDTGMINALKQMTSE